jgi:hypothetical protein
MATLETHHTLCTFGEPIDQLALALVAPLGAHDHYISTFGCIHFASRFK